MKRILLALLLIVAVDWAPGIPPYPILGMAQLKAQQGIDGLPPNRFHPFAGSTNCIQVVDINRNFSCAPGTKVDPTTGNMVIGGTITFLGSTASFAPGGIALTSNKLVQTLGSSDLVIGTSPPTVATSGPLIAGVTIRVRQGPGGTCQLVVAGGNGLQEFTIPVAATNIYNTALNAPVPGSVAPLGLLYTFPGGPSGC